MQNNMSYGELLREARERNGFDVATMSRRLHIRPDILKAIETSDFDRIPARGYAKNMVRAYAMQVGLDPRTITDMFLDDMELYELGDFNTGWDDPASSRRDRRSSSQRRSSSSRAVDRSRSVSTDGRSRSMSTAGSRSASRSMDGMPRSSRSLSTSQSFADRAGRSSSSRRSGNRGNARGNTVHQSFTPGGGFASTIGNTRSSMGNSGFVGLSLPMIVGICVVAVIIIAFIVVIFNSGKQSVEDVPDIPISGLTNTAAPEDDAATVKPVSPTSVVFSFSVENGAQSWIEVYENDSDTPVFAGVVEGPDEQEYTVTDMLYFRTANPSPVKLTLDGEEVQAMKEADSEYYVYTVDFEKFLTDWEIENGIISDSASGSTGNSSNSSRDSSASNASNRSNDSNGGNQSNTSSRG